MGRVQATAHYIYFAKNTWNLAKRLGATSLIFRASMPKLKMANATGGCPESAGKWQQKNMIGMWKNYDRLSLSCAQSGSGQRPLFLTTTSRPAMVPGQTARPAATTIGPNFNSVTTKKPIPHWTDPPPKPLPGSNDLTAQLKSAGCKCHAQTGITVVSTDSRAKSKHADQLGKYQFKGQMHSGRPVYVNAAGTYSMYWNTNTKAWEVGKSVGGTAPTMKTQEKTIRFAQQTLSQEFRRNGPGRTCGASGAGTKHWSSSACSSYNSVFTDFSMGNRSTLA